MSASALETGLGDLQKVVLRHRGASAEIYLFGATLCSYTTPNGQEQIFVSPGAIFDGKKAIRGGVPLVFPQFGQPDKAMPQHGVARTAMWTLKEMADSPEDARVLLELTDSPATREKWDHAFTLQYTVLLTAVSLKMTLCVKNTGEAPFSFQALLHTYFKIPDISTASVGGLTGRRYLDKVANDEKLEEAPEVVLPAFTDRVYVGSVAGAKDVTVFAAGSSGKVITAASISEGIVAGTPQPCDVVVWNPYADNSPGDLPPPAFKEFVCVEPGLVSKNYDLPAGATAELSQKILPMV